MMARQPRLTLWDEPTVGMSVVGPFSGDLPYEVRSCNATVARFRDEDCALEYASWPSRKWTAVDSTAEAIIAAARDLPYEDGRNMLQEMIARLGREVAAWDRETEPEGDR